MCISGSQYNLNFFSYQNYAGKAVYCRIKDLCKCNPVILGNSCYEPPPTINYYTLRIQLTIIWMTALFTVGFIFLEHHYRTEHPANTECLKQSEILYKFHVTVTYLNLYRFYSVEPQMALF